METSKESGHLILGHDKMEQSTIHFQSCSQRLISSRDNKTFSSCHLNQSRKACELRQCTIKHSAALYFTNRKIVALFTPLVQHLM